MINLSETIAPDLDLLVAEVADRFTNDVKQGRSPTIDAYVERYPQIAAIIRAVFPALAVLDGSQSVTAVGNFGSDGESPLEEPAVGILGDFRILRELGRGGMGVVYEAEQISLGRRVALKVLPFAAMLDKQQLARFKNEARAAATLDHANIVAIYSVGVERGVHYYAMQLVEGRSLAEIITAMRPGRPPSAEGTAAVADPANRSIAADTAKAALPTVHASGCTAFSNHSPPCSSLPAFNSRDYYQSVARLGVQAAEALDHAHQNGILHRDIKPANLMLDDAGKLWITDFGLARIEQDAGLTMTGDLLGTLRYMSPEQALAKRVVVDHRSDIYSLGVTLYELLTLQPTFTGDDRQELLRQIAFDEPRKPRQLNGRIPPDLETIVVKAIEKNPTDRYATALELANDLRRFTNEQPIKAKPQSILATARKWSRRNRPIVWASALTLTASALAVAASIGWTARDKQMRQVITNAIATTALDDASRLTQQSEWSSALVAARRADDILTGTETIGPLADRTKETLGDIQMVLRLDDLAVQGDSTIESQGAAYLHAEHSYSQFFRDYGIDVDTLDPSDAVRQIRSRPIYLELASALDIWATWRRLAPPNLYPDKLGKQLLDLARAVDPDPWRNRLRDALECRSSDERQIAFAALEAPIEKHSVSFRTLLSFAAVLQKYGNSDLALKVLIAAQRDHPNDFRVNELLANVLMQGTPPKLEQAIRFYTSACALRPDSADTHSRLGVALLKSGQVDEAISQFELAIALKPDFYFAHYNLGTALNKQGRKEEAQPHLRIAEKDPNTWEIIASSHFRQDDFRGAAEAFTKAIELDPHSESIWFDYVNRGTAYHKWGHHREAIHDFDRVIELSPINTDALLMRGEAHYELAEFEASADDFSKALEIRPNHPRRGVILKLRGQCYFYTDHYSRAIDDYSAALKLLPDDHAVMNNLAALLSAAPNDAVRDGRRALDLATKACELIEHNNASYVVTLAGAYAEVGDFDSATKWAEKAVELSDPKLRKHFVERLDTFRQHKPWREPGDSEVAGQ